MAKEDELIETVMKIAEDDSPRVKKGVDKFLENVFEHGMLPKDALGIKEQDTEALYAQAYQMYNMGKYQDARAAFASLVTIDQLEPRFLFGHAACSHMLGEYQSAADVYMHQAIISPDDPVPYYHAADCYLKLGDTFSATVALKMVVERAGKEPKYATIKERSQMTVKNIEDKIKTEELGTPEDIKQPKQEKTE